jgi:large subunit ribosomal protein L19
MSATAKQRKIISPVDTGKRQEIEIQSGDTVRVTVKIPEGDGFRLQPFEGIVLSRKHGSEPGATFTVRKEIDGVGVEKIFPLYSPRIDEITIVQRATTRKSKLYHIRDKAAKQVRRQMRNMVQVNISTNDEGEEAADEEGQTESTDEDGGEATNAESENDSENNDEDKNDASEDDGAESDASEDDGEADDE